jgi:hypothetical protein
LFVIDTRRETITFPVVGMHRHAHFMERKAIVRQFARRRKPHATCMIVLRIIRTRILFLYNNRLRRTRRKQLPQVVHTIVPRIFSTTAS